MAKLPYMQFFPTDWLADTRMLTPSAKGIWIDTLADLWSAPERGLREASEREWARLWGVEPERVSDLVDQLGNVAGIRREGSGKNPRILIFSRRLIRDEAERERSRESKKPVESRNFPYRDLVSRKIPGFFPEDSRKIPGDIPESRVQTPEEGVPVPREGPPTEDDCVQFALSIGESVSAEWRESYARTFFAVWAERDWRPQAGHNLAQGGKWKHRLRGDMETAVRNQEHLKNNGKQHSRPTRGTPSATGTARGGGRSEGEGISVPSL